MSVEIKRTQGEIDEILNKCAESIDTTGPRWPAMTYEQGVEAALRWVMGEVEENPMEDE